MINFKFNNKEYGKHLNYHGIWLMQKKGIIASKECCMYNISYYINKERHGKCFGYHENYNIHFECYYKNGRIRGKYIKYDENSNIEIKCYFKNGKIKKYCI
jgi:antitoxin component YwqK of YwqJK toxin-antitoxin module